MITFDPTAEQRANLAKLADHLDGLPRRYKHFNITTYASEDQHDMPIQPLDLEDTPCGTAACAIGHGPWAGIPVIETDWSWPHYARRVFGTDDCQTDEGEFMFGVDNPNGPRRAAARIRKVLAKFDA